MSQTAKKWDSLLLVEVSFEWYEGAIAFRDLFGNNVVREQLDKKDFNGFYGNIFFESFIAQVLDRSYV